MRRKDKEISDRNEIDAIIHKADVCRLAMVDGAAPYIVPLNFGFAHNALYFHSALKGRKINILKNNPEVCFEFDENVEIVAGQADDGCSWGTRYKSVVGFGTARFVTEPDAKKAALNIIMTHYAGKTFTFSDADVTQVAVIKIDIHQLTGKAANQ